MDFHVNKLMKSYDIYLFKINFEKSLGKASFT